MRTLIEINQKFIQLATSLSQFNEALAVSWKTYTRDVILSAKPKHVICMGKGVAAVVEPDLKKHFPEKYSVVAQPNAFLSSEAHMANFIRYSKVCNSYK